LEEVHAFFAVVLFGFYPRLPSAGLPYMQREEQKMVALKTNKPGAKAWAFSRELPLQAYLCKDEA
jgi:hypothetical protein